MSAKRIKTCQICKSPFKARRDAKTCSPACRKKLQRSLRAQAAQKTARLESAIGREFHRLAADLFKNHIIHEPMVFADERGGIPVDTSAAPAATGLAPAPPPEESRIISAAEPRPNPPTESPVVSAPSQPAQAQPATVPSQVAAAPPLPQAPQQPAAPAGQPESLEAVHPLTMTLTSPSGEQQVITDSRPSTYNEQPLNKATAPLPGAQLMSEKPSVAEKLQGNRFSPFRFNRPAFMLTGVALVVIALVGLGSLLFVGGRNASNTDKTIQNINNYPETDLQLGNLQPGKQLEIGQAESVLINGRLEVANTLVLEPTATPANPVKGQFYYDEATNVPYYYNGSQFVNLSPEHVTSVGGASGVITLGNGLTIVNNQLDVTGSLEVNGGVLSLKGVANQVNVSANTGHITLSLPQDIATASTPTFGGLTLNGGLNVTAGGATINGTVTLGSLGAGLVQSSAAGVLSSGVVDRNDATYLSGILTVPNGGTGAGSLTTNGIIYGNGTGALQATASVVNSVLVTNGAGVPSLSQTLPLAVQNNITQTGQLIAGSINNGFGTISTDNNITTTALMQAGSLEVDGGSFTVDGLGNFIAYGTGVIRAGGGLTIGVAGTTTGSLTLADAGSAFVTTVQAVAQAGQNQTILLPASNVASDEFCLLTLGNCIGTGGAVSASGGIQNYITKFTNAAGDQIGNSLLYDNGTSVGVGTALPGASYLFDINGTLHVAAASTFDNTLTITAGGASVTGNISQVGTGTFSTGTGAVSLNGTTSVTGSNTFNVGTGTATFGGALNVTTGLTTLSGGLGVTGATNLVGFTNINVSGTANTFIGNPTGTLGLASSTFNLSTGGAISGVTGYSQASGNFSQAGTGTFSTGTGAVSLNGATTVAGNLTVQGSGGITVGIAGTTAGIINLANGTNSNLSVINPVAPTGAGDATYNLPAIVGGTSDNICLQTLDNCTYTGTTAGGDLTGTYPNPTIAKLQGTTLTITAPSAGQVLQYNGSAFVNGLITNSNLQAGTFSNITGTGALDAGSITSGFGSIDTGADAITTTGTIMGGIVNATSTIQLNGTDINTAGTLSNVAYENQANNFTLANTFSAAGTALSVTNNASIGGTLTVTGTINTATISGGTLSGGTVSGGTLDATSVNGLSVSGGTITNPTIAGTVTGSGTPTITGFGTYNGQTISSAANFTGTLTVQGSTLTVGTPGATAGNINLANATSTRQVVLQGLNPSGAGDATIQIPTIAGGSTDTVCLVTLGNCAGSGTGVTSSGGSNGTIAMFTAAQNIENSIITQSGSAISVAGTLTVTGASSLTLGTASTNTGAILFKNSTNANTLTLQSGATGSNLTFTLPTADGSNGDCLQTNASGVLSFGACTGGAGGGVTSLDGLTGVLTIANSSGAGSTITIDNASTAQKGIAQFNSTNFTDNGSGTINTVQNINTTATPTFAGTILGAASTTTGTAKYYNAGGAGSITLTPANPGVTDYTLTLPAENGTLCSTGSVCTGYAPSSGSGSYIQNGTVLQTNANFNVQSAAVGSVGGIIQGASGQTANIFEIKDGTGAIISRADSLGGINSTRYLRVDSSGSSFRQYDAAANPVFEISGAQILMGAGATTADVRLLRTNVGEFMVTGVNGATDARLVVKGLATQSGDLLQLQNSTGTPLSKFDANGNLLAGGAATATTGTTTGTGTNTTTLTLTSDAFAVNDVVFIDNAGQDYYTRITVDPGTGSYTVDPAITFETARTVTKYTIQNIGATTSDYTTQANRFFQGSFLGQVTVGAGTTKLSDGQLLLQSDTNLYRSAANTLKTDGNFIVDGDQFTNNASTLNSAQSLGDFPTGGAIGTAAATVDVSTSFAIAQTTAGQTLSLPSPTVATAGRVAYILNTGSVSFTMHSVTIPAGYGQIYIWNGTSWILGASGGGSAITLQAAYDGGNTLTTSNARDIEVTLNDTAADANFIIDVATGSTGELKVQNNGTDVLQIGAAGQLQLDVQGSGGGLLIGGDATLYRSTTNTLRTSNIFVTDGVIGAKVAVPDNSYALDVGGTVRLQGGAYGINFNNGSTEIVGIKVGTGATPDIIINGGALTVANNGNITTLGTINTATISGGTLTGTAVNGLLVAGGTITNPTIAGTVTGSATPTITGFGAYNSQTISATANFTGTVTIQGSNSLNLGVASSATGSAKFLSASGAGSITLSPANPGVTDYNLTLPAENGTLCSTGSVCTGYAPSTGGNYIAKNAQDTSSASVTGNLLDLTNTSTGAAGVLSLTNSGTSPALAITQSGSTNPSNLLLVNNNTTVPSGNLLNLQNKGTSEFRVDVNGNITTLGNMTLGSLGTNDTSTYICRNSINQLASCTGTGAGAAFVQGGNSFGATAVLGTNDNFGLNIETNNTTVASLSNTGAALFKNSTNSTTAFQVQNTSATGVLTADTANNIVNIGGALNWGLGLAIDAIGDHDGTTVNGAATIAGGKLDRGGDFTPANSYLSIPDDEVDLSGDWSVGMWVNLASTSGTNPRTFAMVDNTNGINLQTGYTTTNAYPYVRINGTSVNATQSLTTGTWQHIVYESSSGTITIYIDGTAYSTSAGGPAADTTWSAIGAGSSSSWKINGYMDEVVLYNRALTLTEVSGRYNGGNGTEALSGSGWDVSSAAVSQWHMDETAWSSSGYRTILSSPSANGLNTNSAFKIQTNTNSTTAFQVQNAAGTAALTVDTTTLDTTLAGDLAIQGGDLTTNQTTFNLLNTTATTLNIGGAVDAGGINLAGGSGSTGCTLDGSNGNFTCSGNITGATTGTVGYWSRSGTTLSPATAGDNITTSGNISTTGSGTLSVAGTSTLTGNVQIGSIGALSNAILSAVKLNGGNEIEFGHSNPAGYRSTIGAGNALGKPFLAFDAEAGTGNDTFRTRGIVGTVIQGDLAGGLTINKVATASADSQSLTNLLTLTNAGNLTATGTVNGATISGGTLSGTAVNGLSVSGTAIQGTGALTIDANGANTISIGATSTGDILLGGGSGSTGCTLTNASGNLTCTGNITGAATGTVGYWSRSGTTLQPATAGDAITTSGNISTSGTGTITSAGLLTGSLGATISGAAINLNASSNFATNINTGSSTGAVAIGNTTAAETVLVQGGTSSTALQLQVGTSGTLSVGNGGLANTIQIGNTTGAVAQTINIGNNATASSTNTVTIGSTVGTSAVTINGGAGATTGITLQSATNATAQAVGSAISVIAGKGGIGAALGTAGTGGALTLSAGAGGDNSSSSADTGSGGSVAISAGNSPDNTGNAGGGNGGNVTITAGNGGNGCLSCELDGPGGSVILRPGTSFDTNGTVQLQNAAGTTMLGVSDTALTSGIANGATAVAFTLQSPFYSTAGAKLLSVKNLSTEEFSVDKDGNVVSAGDVTVQGGSLLTNQTTANLFNTTATTLNIGGAAGAGGIVLAGGSGSTGCTLDGSTGDFTCTGNITGAATGTVGYWSRSGTTLQPATAGDAITTSGSISTTGTGTITAAGILNANATGKTAITIADSGAQSSGITIGGDTNLYRAAAGDLRTDGQFKAGSNVTAKLGLGAYTFIGGAGPGSEAGISFGSAGSTPRFYKSSGTSITADKSSLIIAYDSTAAFQIQDSVASPLLVADTTNMTLSIRADSSQSADILRVEDSGGTAYFNVGSSGGVLSRRTGTGPTTSAYAARGISDSANRINIQAGGTIEWGDGTAALDTNLYRQDAGILQTDGALVSNRSGNLQAFTAYNTALGSNATFNITANGTVGWGPGTGAQDTSLARSGVGELTANGNLLLQGGSLLTNQTTANLFNTTATTLNVGGAVGAGGIVMAGGSGSTGCTLDGSNGNFTCSGNITGAATGTVGYWTRAGTTLQPATAGDNVQTSGNLQLTSDAGTTTSGIQFGSTQDTNLYRSSANNLTTGGSFRAEGEVYARNSGNWIAMGAAGPSSEPGLNFLGDTQLYRSAAATLTTNSSLLANGAATATTGTTTGTGTNTTTLTLTSDAFSVNDVVFIDNAGQDYYTRITVDPATGSYTVDPAVTFETTRTVTKYTIQNIGATTTDYTTQANRFFQGYFTGGVVTGAGSTIYGDSSITMQGDTNLYRGGANLLKTDDSLIASGTVTASYLGFGSTAPLLGVGTLDYGFSSSSNNLFAYGGEYVDGGVGQGGYSGGSLLLKGNSSGRLYAVLGSAGAEISTWKPGSVALTVANNDSSPTANLQEWKSNGSTVAQLTAAGALIATSSVTAGQFITASNGLAAINLTATTGTPGITIGGDTNLYRVSASILQTDGSLTIQNTNNATNNSALIVGARDANYSYSYLDGLRVSGDDTTNNLWNADKSIVISANSGQNVSLCATSDCTKGLNLQTSTGNVGIGTTNPSTGKLQIDSGASNSPAIYLTSSGAGWGSGVQFNNSTGGTGRNYGIYSGSDGSFHFADGTAGADRLVINNLGAATFKNGTDSTTAFQVQNASSGQILVADTTNGTVGIGSSAATNQRLYIWGGTNKEGLMIDQDVSSTSALLRLQHNGSDVFSVASNGDTVVKNSTNSTTAFQIQNASGTALATADTSNKRINIVGDVNIGSRYDSRLFSDGFESGGFGMWGAGSTGTISASTATVHGGKYAALVNPSSGTGYASTSFGSTATAYARAWVYVSSQTSSNADLLTLEDFADTANTSFTVFRNSGNLWLWNNGTGGSTDSGTALSTGAWHLIEMRITTGNPTGVSQVWLDGTQVINLSGQNNSSNNLDTVRIGDNSGSRTFTAYIDDVAADTVTTGTAASLNVDDSLHVGGSGSFGNDILINVTDNDKAQLRLMETSDRGFNLFYDGGPNQFVLQANDAGTLRDVLTVQRTNGSAVFKNSTNSTSAFDVQNATGTSVLTVDTTNGFVGIGDSSPNSKLEIRRALEASGENGIRISTTDGTDWKIYQPTSSSDLNFWNDDLNTNVLKFTTKGHIAAGGSSTATTATTSGTGTNTTTLTFTGTTSFANNDVLFIDNAGQDYYTRIVSGSTAASVTVSPAVTFENARTVTKYNVQNIGSDTNAAPSSNNNRFFQGYFTGGIVTGTGSTTYTDGNISSTNAFKISSTGLSLQNSSDSAAAFQIQNASSTVLLNVDATNNNIVTTAGLTISNSSTGNSGGSNGGAGSGATGDNGGGGGGGIGGATATEGSGAGDTGGQAVDVSGLFAVLTDQGYATTGPGAGGGSESTPSDGKNGAVATGFGSGGGGAGWYGGDGGNGLYGGGGGGGAGFSDIHTGGTGGQGVAVFSPTGAANTVKTTGTSYTVPAGVTSVKVWAVGAGGGGAGTDIEDFSAGGAGGGGGVIYRTFSVTPGQVITYSLGTAGAAGGGGGNGSAGGNTTVTVGAITLTANGGSGGIFDTGATGAGGSFSGQGGVIALDVQDSSNNSILMVDGTNDRVGIGTTLPSYKLDVQDSQASTYVAQIYNTSTANTADGLLINLGVANASRGTGNYFIGFAGAGTVAGKIQGGASVVAYTTTGADYAEYFLAADPANKPQPGTIVALSPTSNHSVQAADQSRGAIVGVISESPGFLGNGPLCVVNDDNCDADYEQTNVIVGMTGQLPVKVSGENGAIAIGDPIAIGSADGVGVKATQSGEIVGYAMEPFTESGTGTIKVNINPGYYSVSSADYVQNGGNAALNNLTVSGTADFANINVSGGATINDLTVTGSASINNLTVATLNASSATIAELHVTGSARFDQDITVGGHIITAGGQPTSEIQTAAGSVAADNLNGQPPTVTITGNDTSGTITITTSDNPAVGDLVKIIFSKAYGQAPHIVLSPSNDKAAGLRFFKGATSTTDFMFNVLDTPQANTAYTFDYFIAQ